MNYWDRFFDPTPEQERESYLMQARCGRYRGWQFKQCQERGSIPRGITYAQWIAMTSVANTTLQ